MKKNELTKSVMLALLLTSSYAMAEEYPAANYEPKVLYSNPDYKATESAAPAKAKAAEPVEVDPNFPAANYQPKVLFNDAAYKHGQSLPAGASSQSSASAESSDESVGSAPSASEGSSNNNSLFGLIALAAVGFFLYSKKAAPTSSSAGESASDYVSSGATGVEKYLEKQGINKTGVAKYLEKQGANPATGVAKYMAKQIVKDREAAAARTTGVEKYLRDKG